MREAVIKNCAVFDEPTATATRKALLDDTLSVTSRSALAKALADYDSGIDCEPGSQDRDKRWRDRREDAVAELVCHFQLQGPAADDDWAEAGGGR
jgi:hypothetical protein